MVKNPLLRMIPHKLYLETGKTWGTIAFYESIGFTVTVDLPRHFYKVDFVEMTKFLA